MMQKKKKTVNLIGYSVDPYTKLPKGDNWTLNALMYSRQPINLHFYLHDKYSMAEYNRLANWANERGIPVALCSSNKDFDFPFIYPLKAVIKRFGNDYFTSTLAYMLALAIHLGYEKIRIIGMPYYTAIEWFEQKACAEFWIGVAIGRGIEVEITHSHSIFLQQPDGELYGYEKKSEDIK